MLRPKYTYIIRFTSDATRTISWYLPFVFTRHRRVALLIANAARALYVSIIRRYACLQLHKKDEITRAYSAIVSRDHAHTAAFVISNGNQFSVSKAIKPTGSRTKCDCSATRCWIRRRPYGYSATFFSLLYVLTSNDSFEFFTLHSPVRQCVQ